MCVKKVLMSAAALSLLVAGTASASNDPVAANPNTGANFNRYSYAANNPYKFTDPDGRTAIAAGAAIGCAATGPACPVGATAGAVIGFLVDVAVISTVAILVYNEVVDDAAEPGPSDSGDRPSGDDIKIDDKIKDQLGGRGWTEDGVRDVTKGEPAGTTVDNTGGKTGDKGEPATVYGSKDGGYVVVNDKTGEVVQVGAKENWNPDPRIKWNDE